MKRLICLALLGLTVLVGCVTQKQKGADVGWFKRGYHNLTTHYNYWFNADELLDLNISKLEEQHKDNYNRLLPIYAYTVPDPQGAKSDMDNIIKKSSKAIALHRVGDWDDDCYLLLGQAQFLKRDFETAEATFKYIREEYDPRKTNKSKLKSSKKKKADSKKKKSSKKKKAAKKKKKKKKSSKKKSSAAKDKKSGASGKTPDKTTSSDPKNGKTPPKKDKPEEPTLRLGNNPYKKGLQRPSAYPESMVWYVRTLAEREKYEEADFLLRDLDEDPFFPNSLRDDLYTAEAYTWVKQKRYDKALDPLRKAVELTRKKKTRARLAYVLAHLYDLAGRHEDAYVAYNKVLASSPKYEMEFNARLHLVQAGWANGKIPSPDATRSLEKMAKDEKNADYRDQIYYVMAEIALKEHMTQEAIAYLRQSLQYSKDNVSQKAESYLKLADLYFEDEDFVNAKNYYDSTLTVLPTTDERHKRATEYAENLNDIARLIKTIAANDSIINVAQMSPEARKELAKKIKKQRDAEASAQAAADAIRQAQDANTSLNARTPTPTAGQAKSTFYFYNEAFLKKGRKDFGRTWGDRKLEDNWRRSRRPQTGGPDDAAKTDQADAVSDREVEDIFKGIPTSEGELAGLHAANYEALYQLGTLFRDKLRNHKRSTGTLETMITRYPDTLRREKEAFYYCYLGFTDLDNKEKAQYYYDKLVGKYPTSNFARALTDPNFVNANRQRERELNEYYEATFNTFQKGDYKDAFSRCEEAPKRYGSQNALMAKFALLSALCVGNLQGNEAYCAALTEVIARYPNSGEATRAKEIARLLACKGFEVAENKTKAPGGAAQEEAFTVEDDKLHYFIVMLSGKDVKIEDVKAAISDFNREYHKLEQLRISNIFLGTDTETPIIVIRKFDNKEQAMRYYNEVKGKKEFLGETGKKNFNKELYAVTQENYRRILKNKTLDGYREFFSDHYLK